MPDRDDLTRDNAGLPPLAAALLIASAGLCVLWFFHARGYWEDDAWIHLEFARSLAAGRGFSFNGHVVYGDTSPLWVFLLDAAHFLFANWIRAGKALCMAGLLFALTGVFAYAQSLVALGARPLGRRATLLFASAMVLLVVTGPYFGYWAFSGMEALSAAGLACWIGVLVAPDQMSPARFLVAALAAGLSPLLRPEMSFFALLVGLVLLRRLFQTTLPARGRALLAAAGIALLAAPATCWDVYALHTFGRVFPNTNAAKRASPHDSVVMHLLNVYGLGFPLVLVGLTLLALALAASLRGSEPHAAPASQSTDTTGLRGVLQLIHAGGWIPILWTLVNSLFYVVNHTYVQTRYILVTAPVVLIVLMALAAKMRPALYRVGLAAGLLFGFAVSFLATWPLVRNKVQGDALSAQIAQTVRSLPPTAPVALYSIGEIAFLSEHPIVDTGGITRPGILPYLNDPDNRRQMLWMRGEGAQYLLAGDQQPEPGAVSVWQGQTPELSWHLDPRTYRNSSDVYLWKLAAQP